MNVDLYKKIGKSNKRWMSTVKRDMNVKKKWKKNTFFFCDMVTILIKSQTKLLYTITFRLSCSIFYEIKYKLYTPRD